MKTLLSLLAFCVLILSPLALRAAETTEGFPVGTEITLAAVSDGFPAPTFEWFRNDVKIADGQTYTITALSANDGGRYTVKATNVAGSATSDPYTIQVQTAPTKPDIRVTSKRPSDVTVSVQPGMKVVTQK